MTDPRPFRKTVFFRLKGAWMAFAAALGWVNTRVLLTIVYFTIFAVGALLLRLLRKDPLGRRTAKGGTYWMERNPADETLERSKHQF